MSQQVFDGHWPLAKNGANELIPGAAILQKRDGKDEPITLAGASQYDPATQLYLPTHKDNPLEARVRELEKLIGEIAADPAANTVQDRLKTLADRLGEAVADPSANTLMARLKQVEAELTLIKDALGGTLMVDGEVQLKGSLPEFVITDWSELPNPEEAPVGASARLVGTFDVRENTGTEWVEVVL